MHGIADPLTKLALPITAGGTDTAASVRAWKLREEGGGPGDLTRRTRLCKGSHVRRLFDGAFHWEDTKLRSSQQPQPLQAARGL